MASTINATPTSSGLISSADASGVLALQTGGTTAVTIDASQNVTLNNVIPSGSTAPTNGMFLPAANTIGLSTASTERMRIDSSGGLILAGSTAQKATGTTWSNPSDARLKDNIRDYTKGIDELMQVRVREWEYNGKGGTTEGTKGLGVVADEVMVVLPNTVENYETKLNADDEEVSDIKKFDATEITWLLVKTVQEQQALITDLTTRLVALENT